MELVRKTLNLRAGDWELLKELYAPKGFTPSMVVRQLTATHVDNLKVDAGLVEDLGLEIELYD